MFAAKKSEVQVILDFTGNSLITVEMAEKGLYRIIARTDDNLYSGEAILSVKLPALDIQSARLEVKRDRLGIASDLSSHAEKLVGVRVGPGMTQIVRGILAGENGSQRMADLVLEAMEMLVNALTVPELRKATEAGGVAPAADSETGKIRLNDVVIGKDMVGRMAANPRLKDSCAAFLDL
jgi:hypothetical protein